MQNVTDKKYPLPIDLIDEGFITMSFDKKSLNSKEDYLKEVIKKAEKLFDDRLFFMEYNKCSF